MNRYQAELQRLYRPLASDAAGGADDPAVLAFADARGHVRALVLELARPAAWDDVARVWQGVQADLQLPAPAIAVSGGDAYQLWFSLAEAVPLAQARGFLAALGRRYLPHVPRDGVAAHPSDAARTLPLPPFERTPGAWSAFVAPDLAPLFADERLLDLAPGVDAQAELLAKLQSIARADWQRALDRLAQASASPQAAAPEEASDPRRFLLEVMNDRTVDLHLRIEAAKALLPWCEGRGAP